MRNNGFLLVLFFLLFSIQKSNCQSLTDCDYLIIAPSNFVASGTWVNNLITLQESRGFTPYLYSVVDGTTANTIKNQITTAYNNGIVLKYILIVGNGSNIEVLQKTNEVTNFYIQSGIINETVTFSDGNYVPFWSMPSENRWGNMGVSEVSSDDLYIEGLTNRGAVYIGRIPAESLDEINAYVNKLTTYYSSISTYSNHNSKELYIGRDVSYEENGCLGSHVNDLRDTLINNFIPSYLTVTQLNVSDHDASAPFEYSATRASLFESALNSGVGLITMLSTTGGPMDLGGFYWNSNNANFNFTNTNKLPFLLGMNCMQGYVNDLRWGGQPSAMRQLMMYSSGGIIGSIAPTEGSVQHINGTLLNLAHEKIFNDNIVNVGQLHSILKSEIKQNYPQHEFFANGLTLFADPSMALSVFQHKSGNIYSSTTWEGNIIVDNNVTIQSSGELKIKAGTVIRFNNNSKLIVNGTLNVNGLADNQVYMDFVSKSSNGIYCYLGSNVNIDNAIIKNASYGVYASYAYPIVKNTSIINTSTGIMAYYSIPWVENCFINESYTGIYLYKSNTMSGDPTILNNIIHFSDFGSSSSPGIYLYNSGGKIRGNEISRYDEGVYCNYLSSPYLGQDGLSGNNKIYNNYVGIKAYNNSDPFLGRNSCTIQGGNNSIYNNQYKNAYASSNGSVIQAEDTWWGSAPPDLGKFYVGSGCTIDYFPYLNDNPLQKIIDNSLSPEETLFNSNLAMADNDSKILKEYNYDKKWTLDWKIHYLRNLVMVKDYKYAQTICQEIIEEYPDSIQAQSALNLYIQVSKDDDVSSFLSYLEKQVTKKKLSNLYGTMELIISDFDLKEDKKVDRYDEVVQKYRNKEMEEIILFHNLNHQLMELNNKTEARKILDEIEVKFKNSELASLALRLLRDDDDNSENNSKTLEKETTVELVDQYELFGNYPNPFNPSTKIKYATPFVSNVRLEIYDITGRMVKSFEVNSQNSGNHEFVWDGTNITGSRVASGIYFYKLKALSLQGNGKVFEKTAKLLLMK